MKPEVAATRSLRRLAFPASRRLLAHAHFQRVFAEGREAPGRYLVAWVRQAPDAGRRLGVVATKRTFHDAVDRNRAKRLIRESFRRIQHDLVDDPWDLVVLARRRILDVKQPQVQEDLARLCVRQGILRRSR
ncbi:MAG: ribonuclease P protein component [Kiritimatiellia bacterium]|jgi:ribonuclease P protein component